MSDTRSALPPLTRRTMLGFVGAGALTAGVASLPASAADTTPDAPDAATSDRLPAPGDGTYWRQVSRLFTLDPAVLFMNVGTVGSPPRETIKAVDAELARIARDAVSSYSSFDDTRALMARGFGCDADEIAITHNTSDGMAKALMGLDLGEGDEILTTTHEHVGGIGPMSVLRDRKGVKITMLPVPLGNNQRAEDYVELFRKGITAKTKVLLFSAPTYKTGTMLPIAMLGKLAQDHGLTTVVDAAHVPGMMAYKYRELGVDLLAGSMAKWQCAPAGTGVLYIRNKTTTWDPKNLPTFWPVISSSYPEAGLPSRASAATATYDAGKYVTSVGNGPAHQVAGIASACTVWDRIGRARIQDYILGLSAYLKDLVAERWGVDRLYSPKDDPRLVCALTSWNPFQNPADVFDKTKSDAFVAQVKSQFSITIRNVDFPIVGTDKRPVPVRVSTHLFHNRGDVERVVDACWTVSMAMK